MRPSIALALILSAAACRPAATSTAAIEPAPGDEASGPAARWSYEIRVDEQLERMELGLCIEGPLPRRLITADDAIAFVSDARVRGGPELAREGQSLAITTLGQHGCVDLEIDLERAASASGRGSIRRGDTLMLGPDRWLWYPGLVPDHLEARARFELPEGVAATVPWPRLDPDEPGSWRLLDPTSFGWNAWIAFGRQPLEFVAGECEFEVAILDGERRASDEGIEAWLQSSAETVAQLYGRFPRERVAVVVVPTPSFGETPVLFGMARRGGGGSVMLLLNDAVEDHALPGEWVAVHELLHLGMPLIAEPWMSEGFVTYYTQVLRARRGLLAPESDAEAQTRAALERLHAGFEARPSARTLASASETMRQRGDYQRVYWGGAAIAFDLDVRIRGASHNRRSLDDLMLALEPLAPHRRRFTAADLLARMDEELARWHAAGELEREISCSEIASGHLSAKTTPPEVQRLRGVAVSLESGRLRLLANPIDEAQIRSALFAPKSASRREPE
ncbi:MAG: hypothetical protein R6X02_13710 [Enhygromyxa sp.]